MGGAGLTMRKISGGSLGGRSALVYSAQLNKLECHKDTMPPVSCGGKKKKNPSRVCGGVEQPVTHEGI